MSTISENSKSPLELNRKEYRNLFIIWLGLMTLFILLLVYAPAFLKQLRTTDPAQYRVTGTQNLQEKKYDEAIADFKIAVELAPNDPQNHFLLGRTYRLAGKNELAEQDLLIAIQKEPKNIDYLHELGWVYQSMGRMDKELGIWQQYKSIEPDRPESYFQIGELYNRMKDSDRAIEYLNKSISMDSTYANAYRELAKVYYSQNLYDKAFAPARRAIELKLVDDFLWYAMGIKYGTDKQWNLAIEAFQKAVGINPTYYWNYYGLAMEYMDRNQSGDLEQAEKTWKIAISLSPDRPESYYELGVIAQKRRKPQEAVNQFQEAIKRDATNKWYYLGLGDAYLQLGNKSSAQKAYQDVIRLEPGNETARRSLASITSKGN